MILIRNVFTVIVLVFSVPDTPLKNFSSFSESQRILVELINHMTFSITQRFSNTRWQNRADVLNSVATARCLSQDLGFFC